jgi:yecA family protein
MQEYEPVQACLLRLGAHIDAAGAQGLACGLLMGNEGFELWLSHSFDQPPDERDLNARDCLDRLRRLYEETRVRLNAEDFALELLLPGEDEDFSARLMALADWCQGLLYGLGVLGEQRLKALSEQGRECMNDLLEIGKLSHDEEENDENEGLFAELVEHVRLCVIYLNEELNPVSPTAQQVPH